jgi:hypothetical protein
MTQKQRQKHIADNAVEQKRLMGGTEKEKSGPTPDGLGEWEGGTAALKGSRTWVSEKLHPSRTASNKNTSGKSSSDVVEHSVDFYHGKKRDPHYAERVAAEVKIIDTPPIA